jgi:prevent-host-death family protein
VPTLGDQPERRQVIRIADPWIRLAQLRGHAARYLDRVAAGETIGIVRDGELVARIVSAVDAPG